MKKDKNLTRQILNNNMYAFKEVFRISKARVVLSLFTRLIDYLIWVFYSAFFVRFILDAIQNERPLKEILVAILLIGGISLLLQAFQFYCTDALFPMLDIKIFNGMYKKLYQKSENVELGCYETSSFYDKFSVALDDMGRKLCESVDTMSTVFGGIIGGALACYTMIEIDPWTIVFLVAPLIGNFFFAPKMNNIYYHEYLDSVPYERKMEYVNRVMYLKEYAKEFRLSNIFNVISDKYNEAVIGKSSVWRKYFNKGFFIGLLQYIFSYVIIFEGILIYGAYRAIVPQANMITFAEMAVLSSVMVTASWVWVQVINAINRGTQNSLMINNLKEFLEYEEKIPEDQDGIIPDAHVSSIEFSHVSFSYDGENDVIHDLSFIINENINVALVGHNGAGKSTIIKLLLRMYDPTNGFIKVNGVDIREYNLRAYRQLFGCAFQDCVLMPGTVRYNVLMGRDGTDEQVVEALTQAGIVDKVRSLPKGIDTNLTKEFDDDGALLSGGESQKIIVARTFASPQSVALFDEPSSALDPISENELFSSILAATKGKIGVLISHRLSCVKDADYVYMLEHGTIIERGTHNQLINQHGPYADMYLVQEQNYFALDNTESVGDAR